MRKNSLYFFAVMLIFSATAFAQKKNSFRGLVKIEIETQGQKYPVTYKIWDNKVFTQNQMVRTLANNNIIYYIFDFSQYMGPLEMEGSGKYYTKDTLKHTVSTEKATIEYTSEIKKILDFTAKKAVIKSVDEEGKKEETAIWYSDEIGSEYSALILGLPLLQGFPLEMEAKEDDGSISFKLTTLSIEPGKVKEAELLLPAGYEEVKSSVIEEIISKLRAAMGGGDEDDE